MGSSGINVRCTPCPVASSGVKQTVVPTCVDIDSKALPPQPVQVEADLRPGTAPAIDVVAPARRASTVVPATKGRAQAIIEVFDCDDPEEQGEPSPIKASNADVFVVDHNDAEAPAVIAGRRDSFPSILAPAVLGLRKSSITLVDEEPAPQMRSPAIGRKGSFRMAPCPRTRPRVRRMSTVLLNRHNGRYLGRLCKLRSLSQLSAAHMLKQVFVSLKCWIVMTTNLP